MKKRYKIESLRLDPDCSLEVRGVFNEAYDDRKGGIRYVPNGAELSVLWSDGAYQAGGFMKLSALKFLHAELGHIIKLHES